MMNNLFGYDIMYPNRLWLVLIVIPLLAWYFWKNWDKWATIKFSNISHLKSFKSWKAKLRHLPFLLEVLALIILIFAYSRPRKILKNVYRYTQGIDIVLAIDISPSMLARDFKHCFQVQYFNHYF